MSRLIQHPFNRSVDLRNWKSGDFSHNLNTQQVDGRQSSIFIRYNHICIEDKIIYYKKYFNDAKDKIHNMVIECENPQIYLVIIYLYYLYNSTGDDFHWYAFKAEINNINCMIFRKGTNRMSLSDANELWTSLKDNVLEFIDDYIRPYRNLPNTQPSVQYLIISIKKNFMYLSTTTKTLMIPIGNKKTKEIRKKKN